MKYIIFLILSILSYLNILLAEECQRGEPVATLSSNFPIKIRTTFSNQKQIFTESFTFNNQQFIIIENKGCENYWIEYTFKFPINNKIDYYLEIQKSLSIIEKHNESSINIAKILSILKKSNEKNIINKDISLSKNEFGEYFTLTKNKDKKEIVYSISAVIGL
ncbi:hypothetical protein [Leptospira bandrabouensis]|uniref:hypothetical protein n=1 Tax=Leptospira bandrabouensis TaxID=2484903 RepID=UPI001EE9877B|nr:hypothetical protein [Leptospira bandrabouensis]MCG6162069.1 hypothetical protein [Leptospira bandrabouensis]